MRGKRKGREDSGSFFVCWTFSYYASLYKWLKPFV
nr:MAG TPA: hypothetical protein [Caudoviricetes sp.]